MHLIDVTQTTSLCTVLPPTTEAWQAHTLFRCLNHSKEKNQPAVEMDSKLTSNWTGMILLVCWFKFVVLLLLSLYIERTPRRVDTIRAPFLSPPLQRRERCIFRSNHGFPSAPSSPCSNETSIEDQLQIINETMPSAPTAIRAMHDVLRRLGSVCNNT